MAEPGVYVGDERVDNGSGGGGSGGGGGGGGDPIAEAIALQNRMQAEANAFQAAQAAAARAHAAEQARLDREFQAQQAELARALSREQFEKTYVENKRQYDLSKAQRDREFLYSQRQAWTQFATNYQLQAEQIKTARENFYANPRNLVQRFGAANGADPAVRQSIERDYKRRAAGGMITPAELASGIAFEYGVDRNYKQPSYELPEAFNPDRMYAGAPNSMQAEPPAAATGGIVNISAEEALDLIAANRPNIAEHYRANGWTINTPEDMRKAIADWLQMTDDPNVLSVGRNPQQYAIKQGFVKPPVPATPTIPGGSAPNAGGGATTQPIGARDPMLDPQQARIQPIAPANLLTPAAQPTISQPMGSNASMIFNPSNSFVDPARAPIPPAALGSAGRYVKVPDLGNSEVANDIEQQMYLPTNYPGVQEGGPLRWEYAEIVNR